MTDTEAVVERLFAAIAHGDADHRAWLKEAITAHFAGKPVPEPRGKGRKEALIEQQAATIAERDARDREIAHNLQDARTTLRKRAYTAIEGDNFVLPSDAFDSIIRNIDRSRAALERTAPDEPLNMCEHGADRGSYCGYCGGYSQGTGK